MKLTRRQALLTLLAFFGFKNSNLQVQDQPPLIYSNDEPIITTEFELELIYQEFLKAAAGGVEDKPVLLYQGIKTSPYSAEITDYPVRLNEKPDGKHLIDGTLVNSSFNPYPALGELPLIDEQSLTFLHEDIKEACVCVGAFAAGDFRTKWLGRNALSTQEFWSATKFISLLYLVCHLNNRFPKKDIDYCQIKGVDQQGNERLAFFPNFATDLVSYEQSIASSNSLGAMFKRFAPPLDLENWLKGITGNTNLVFRGSYGEKPFIDRPQLVDFLTGEVLINADTNSPNWSCNQVSAYDLTRMISMLGWHNYISQEAQLPYAQWHNLESVIRAMGTAPARFTDLAIKALGLEHVLESVVIVSKEGDGATDLRQRTEAVYVANVQFIDPRPLELGASAQIFTFSMALRAGKALEPRDKDREVVELDARMATAVTEIIYRVLMNQLAS
ncbi:MAG TPA: hypothetical protein DDZ80_20820 [Cyanobacteria bacterium UBA8803]|nr:hypothetical protein [Cyanobacteria bacterium UBA9273]HBL60788.1 hypothetical protein [Cyanobacteria bacterium UBA8803]